MRILLFLAAAAITLAQTNLPYQTPTQAQRLKWVGYATLGPPHLTGGIITSAISTGLNSPPEYGPHWDGYFKRQGIRLTGAATSNLIEAELGSLWGEDPRYRRMGTGTVGSRIRYVIRTGFMAYNRQGKLQPAYARFIAVPTSNVISNSWRPDSERTATETVGRVGLGFAVRVGSNAFIEFWPSIRKILPKH